MILTVCNIELFRKFELGMTMNSFTLVDDLHQYENVRKSD